MGPNFLFPVKRKIAREELGKRLHAWKLKEPKVKKDILTL